MKIRYIAILLALLTLGSCHLLDFLTPPAPAGAVPATSLSLKDGTTAVPATVYIELGASKTITAQVLPVGTTDTVTWSSSSPDSVSVTQDGVVTLVAAPSAAVTITATAGSQTATFLVNLSIPATSLNFYSQGPGGAYDTFIDFAFPASTEGTDSYLIQLGAKILPLNSTDPIVWTSSDPSTVSLTDTLPAADGSQPSARTLAAPAAITVTTAKYVKVLQHLTSDVVITATAGSLTKTFTLTPVLTVGSIYESFGGGVYSEIPASAPASTDGSGNAHLQVEFSPANATVTWTCTDTNVTFTNQTTVTISGLQYSRVDVNSFNSSGTPTITATVTTTSGASVNATCTIQQSSSS